MIENILHTLVVGITSIGLVIGSWFGITSAPISPLGAALPSSAANFETSLASAITSTDTSLTLTANSIRGGGSLSGFTCFTLDGGTSSDENVCGTLSGTSMTSLTRGISYANGTTSVTANKFAHRRGTSVKQTDAPLLLIMKAQLNGEETIPNILKYTSAPTFSNPTEIITKGYADALAFGSSTVSVPSGGTGATSFTANQLLIGNGTSAITSTTTPIVSTLTAGSITATSTTIASSFVGIKSGTKVNTEAATTTIDWLQGTTQEVVLNMATTTLAFSNVQSGSTLKLWVFQDATGSRLISTSTYPTAIHWAGGSPPTLTTTAGKMDILVFTTATSTTYITGASSLNY